MLIVIVEKCSITNYWYHVHSCLTRVYQDLRGYKVNKGYKEHKVNQVHKVIRDHKVHLDNQDQLV